MLYYIISTTNQKIGNLFCPVHISGLSHIMVQQHLQNLSKMAPKGQKWPNIAVKKIDSYFWVYNSKGINPDSPASIFKFDGMVQ